LNSNVFSSLQKLVGTVGYVTRFIVNLKKSINKDNTLHKEEILSSDELSNALNLVVKNEQQLIKKQSNYEKLKASLNLFVDRNGLLRLHRRFGNSNMQYEEQYPILLQSFQWFGY
jgi:hypothetical protein